MNKESYPYLIQNKIVHLDASAVFPLHEKVIESVNEAMRSTLGAPGKATYPSSIKITNHTEVMRKQIADFIGADKSEIFLVSSATDAIKTIMKTWVKGASVIYSPEDHSRIVMELKKYTEDTKELRYLENGEYDYSMLKSITADFAILSSMHHMYGSTNDLSIIRQYLPTSKLIVDASQSISRHMINVSKEGIDALFFSSQKLGGIAGVGVLYIAARHHHSADLSFIEPNTIPYVPLVSLSAALDVLREDTLERISIELAKKTNRLIDGLQKNPAVLFSKGPAYPDYTCYGLGIVSFSVEGYTPQDVAMILEKYGINVRAGDHCIDPSFVEQDVIRISAHKYTTDDEIQLLIKAIQSL